MTDTVVVDPTRHLLVFDPFVFDNTRVDVVGCGAVGTRIAMELAKLGVRNLHIWDNDIIESHNIANQLFDLSDIGRQKAEALAERILASTGITPVVHLEKIERPVELGKVVFLAVDTMAARSSIYSQSLRLRLGVDQVIETRMGTEELRVYGFNPRSRDETALWESSLSDDADTVESVCGARTTVGATAGMTACLAVQRFLQWYRYEVVRDPQYSVAPHVEQVMMLRPLITMTR